MSATTKWITLALLGLAIAAAVAFLASRLVSEQIGIASESVSAGYDLAPAVRSATAPNGNTDATTPGSDKTTPSESTTDSTSTSGDDSVGPDRLADEIEDREKEREDELKDLEKEREDREDEARDEEEDRRDD